MAKFPDWFYFGASTASHQVEGGCTNDWTDWEKKNSVRLAKESVKYDNLPSWERIKKQALDPQNYISGSAADHYNLYPKDFDIAKKIGLNAYRFSIEWSRIEPERGKFDKKEISHYVRMIDTMHKRGIEPFVTIWHWTLPLWLSSQGGILHPDFPEIFTGYAKALGDAFAGKVKYFIILNEPEIYSLNSYMRGIWPPERKGIISYMRAIKALIKAHRLAYAELKNTDNALQAGTACNMTFFDTGKNILKRIPAAIAEKFWNFYFTDHIKSCTDFIGLNYYFRRGFSSSKEISLKVSDMGWELYPEGILPVLENLKKFSKPVYITENGLADADDVNREWFIESTLKAVHSAIRNGVDVRGYFHWSLLDNFEWDKGFWPAFGLISVNRKNQSRKIRNSALKYQNIIFKGI